MKNTIYAENRFDGAGTSDEVTNNFKLILCKTVFYKIFFLLNLCLLPGAFNAQALQNANYALYANNIYRLAKYINWLVYNNQGDFLIGIVRDTPLCDEQENFTSDKTVGIGNIVVKKTPSSSDTYDCNFLFIR